jgi:DNA polymerase III subunit delta'
VVVGPDARLPLPWLEQPLCLALQQQRSHALLVQAAQGVGALPFMLTLAQAWLCEVAGDARPCGVCGSCRLVRSGTHPDLHVLLPEALRASSGWAGAGEDDVGDGAKSRKKPSRQIKIDEVRAAIDWIVQTSSRGRAKVLVLHPAEAMNPQAANALLKTLEEPPGQARLLLGTADAAHLLPTLRSRCQRLRLVAPDADAACAWLVQQGVADAAVLLAGAGGAPLDAQALAALGIDGAGWLALPGAVLHGQAEAFSGWPIPRVVDTLQKICHDAMVQGAGGTPRYFTPQSLPAGASLAALGAWARSLGRVARHDEHPWNDGLLIEALVCEGRACWQEATTRAAGTRRALDTLAR